MITTCVRGLTSVVLLAATLVGQQGEADFLESAAEKLHAYAKSCFDNGYPKRAREVWLEVIHDYVTDHEAARKALGFLRAGTSWAEDRNFEYPTVETPDAAAARSLEKKWAKLSKSIGEGHRALGQALKAAGDAAGAERHFDRALRFLPDDAVASKERGLKNHEGVMGTDVELRILRRSQRMTRLVNEQLKKDYKPKKAKSKQSILDKAGVEYRGFETENFAIWGDFEDEALISAANHAERALAFCVASFVGHDRFTWKDGVRYHLGFFKGKPTWEKIIRANSNAFGSQDIEFIIKNASITRVSGGKESIRVGGFQGQAELEDFAVRAVVQDYSHLNTDAMREGIGHAVVGMFFGRNLIFSVAQEEEDGRTSTGVKKDTRLELPDLAVWRDLAAESAWDRSDVKAAKLPLISAASFSSKARIKAWSFCDYLLRRDPPVLLALDKTKSSGASNEGAVVRAFEKDGKHVLALLENDWRDFWIRDTPVMRAIREDKTPLEAVSKIAPVFLEEFNAMRARFTKVYKTEPVGWIERYSHRCKDHALYLKANSSERGPEKEHMQSRKKKGYTDLGREFASTALVETKAKKLEEVVDKWLNWPGYRDALLNKDLANVGIYGAGSIVVMDVTRGIARRPGAIHYPAGNMRGVRTEITVKELGKEIATELKKRKKKAKVIGYPITFHFYRSGALPKEGSVKCTLTRLKDTIDGFVHIGDGGKNRRISAPGLVTFYPYEPLPRGAEISVLWEWEEASGENKKQRFKFKTH